MRKIGPDEKEGLRVDVMVELPGDVWPRLAQWAMEHYPMPDYPGLTDFDAAWREVFLKGCTTILDGITPIPDTQEPQTAPADNPEN